MTTTTSTPLLGTDGGFEYRVIGDEVWRFQHGRRISFMCSVARWEQQRAAQRIKAAELKAERAARAERAAKKAKS